MLWMLGAHLVDRFEGCRIFGYEAYLVEVGHWVALSASWTTEK